MKILGRILLILGAILTVFTIVTVVTSGQLTSVGQMEINNPNKLSFYWSPITAIALLVAGAAILVLRKKEKRKTAEKYYRYYH
jgi:heme/copper-type cytochrome/quinol oxidase subunit 2